MRSALLRRRLISFSFLWIFPLIRSLIFILSHSWNRSEQTTPLITMPNPLWFVFWLLVFWFVSFFVAFFCAFFYIWVYAFASCIPALTVSGLIGIFFILGSSILSYMAGWVNLPASPAGCMRHFPYRAAKTCNPLVIWGTYQTHNRSLWATAIAGPDM